MPHTPHILLVRRALVLFGLITAIVAVSPVMTDAHAVDRDGDGIPSSWERKYRLSDHSKRDATRDSDADLLDNLGEYRARTNPRKADTDRDRLADGCEKRIGLNPRRRRDSAKSVKRALRLDRDRDHIPNLWECRLKLNPSKADTDRDGRQDGNEDFDDDLLTNAFEIAHKLDPRKRDSDGDGTSDARERDANGKLMFEACGDPCQVLLNDLPASARPSDLPNTKAKNPTGGTGSGGGSTTPAPSSATPFAGDPCTTKPAWFDPLICNATIAWLPTDNLTNWPGQGSTVGNVDEDRYLQPAYSWENKAPLMTNGQPGRYVADGELTINGQIIPPEPDYWASNSG